MLFSVLFVLLGRETTEAAPSPPTFPNYIVASSPVVALSPNVEHPSEELPRDSAVEFGGRGESVRRDESLPPLSKNHFYASFVDAEGQPLAGVRVAVRNRPAHVIAGAEDFMAMVEGPLENELFTDESGQIVLAREGPFELSERIYEVDVYADGYASQRFRLVDPGRRRRYRVERPAVLSGRVMNRSTQDPVAGVKVELVDASGFPHQAVSADDGRYRFDRVAPGDATLRILSADYVRLIRWIHLESASRAQKDLLLFKGGRLDVRVQDLSKSPLAGVSVSLIDSGSRPGLVVGSTTTGEDGGAVFQGLRAGRRYVVAVDDVERGVARQRVQGTVGAPRGEDWSVEEEITLVGNWALSGRAFVGGDGRAVPDAWIILESVPTPGLDGIHHRSDPVRADAEGRFEVEGLIEGLTYTAMVYHQEFALGVLPEVTEDDAESLSVEVGLQERRRILGEVSDGNGNPIPFANVYVKLVMEGADGLDKANGILGSEVVVKADADGRYSLDHYPPGTRVRIQAEDPPNNGRSQRIERTIQNESGDQILNLMATSSGQ